MVGTTLSNNISSSHHHKKKNKSITTCAETVVTNVLLDQVDFFTHEIIHVSSALHSSSSSLLLSSSSSEGLESEEEEEQQKTSSKRAELSLALEYILTLLKHHRRRRRTGGKTTIEARGRIYTRLKLAQLVLEFCGCNAYAPPPPPPPYSSFVGKVVEEVEKEKDDEETISLHPPSPLIKATTTTTTPDSTTLNTTVPLSEWSEEQWINLVELLNDVRKDCLKKDADLFVKEEEEKEQEEEEDVSSSLTTTTPNVAVIDDDAPFRNYSSHSHSSNDDDDDDDHDSDDDHEDNQTEQHANTNVDEIAARTGLSVFLQSFYNLRDEMKFYSHTAFFVNSLKRLKDNDDNDDDDREEKKTKKGHVLEQLVDTYERKLEDALLLDNHQKKTFLKKIRQHVKDNKVSKEQNDSKNAIQRILFLLHESLFVQQPPTKKQQFCLPLHELQYKLQWLVKKWEKEVLTVPTFVRVGYPSYSNATAFENDEEKKNSLLSNSNDNNDEKRTETAATTTTTTSSFKDGRISPTLLIERLQIPSPNIPSFSQDKNNNKKPRSRTKKRKRGAYGSNASSNDFDYNDECFTFGDVVRKNVNVYNDDDEDEGKKVVGKEQGGKPGKRDGTKEIKSRFTKCSSSSSSFHDYDEEGETQKQQQQQQQPPSPTMMTRTSEKRIGNMTDKIDRDAIPSQPFCWSLSCEEVNVTKKKKKKNDSNNKVDSTFETSEEKDYCNDLESIQEFPSDDDNNIGSSSEDECNVKDAVYWSTQNRENRQQKRKLLNIQNQMKAERIAHEQQRSSVGSNETNYTNATYNTTATAVRKKRRVFTQEEKDAIRMGVKRFGVGKWKQIKEYHGDELGERTAVQIKDCYRTMEKRGHINF